MHAELKFPKYSDFHWPTLMAVREAGGTATNDEINERVVKREAYSEELQQVLHNAGPRTELEFRIAWARSWLKGMGLLDNDGKGVWSTTANGRSAVETDLPELRARYTADLKKKRKAREQAEAEDAEGAELEDPTDDWKALLLGRMLEVEPDAFERLAQRLLRAAGFVNTNVTAKSGDGGIDGTGDYRISLLTFPVYFQCKRYKGVVGASTVRDFRGAMAGRGDKGLIITTGSFTAAAKEEATRDGAPPIDLIDGDRLCDLLKDHRLGVTVETRTVDDVTIRSEFFDEL